VAALELRTDGFRAEREVEGATEVHEGTLPAVLSCDKGLNEPRYPSLKGIMQAKKKPIAILRPSDVGVGDDDLAGARMLVWDALELPAARAGGRIVQGPPDEAARELVRLLKEEAKVI
jgi:electron transfer flavoprotein beta subunit